MRMKKQVLVTVVLLILLSLSGPFSLPIPNTSVDISFQSLFILLPAFVVPTAWSLTVVLAYFVLGMLGLPVFSGGASGVDVLLGPSLGFFMGFALANYGLSQFNALTVKSFQRSGLYLILAQLFVLLFGFGYLAYIQSDASKLKEAVYFLPGAVFKTLVGAGLIFFWNKL